MPYINQPEAFAIIQAASLAAQKARQANPLPAKAVDPVGGTFHRERAHEAAGYPAFEIFQNNWKKLLEGGGIK